MAQHTASTAASGTGLPTSSYTPTTAEGTMMNPALERSLFRFPTEIQSNYDWTSITPPITQHLGNSTPGLPENSLANIYTYTRCRYAVHYPDCNPDSMTLDLRGLQTLGDLAKRLFGEEIHNGYYGPTGTDREFSRWNSTFIEASLHSTVFMQMGSSTWRLTGHCVDTLSSTLSLELNSMS